MLSPEQINFDDRSFNQLIKEAMQQLPLLNSSWTDYNAHDPGITFLELLTYLTEAQRFYLNEITRTHKLKYLKLLGESLKPTMPARLPIVFYPTCAHIKKGTIAQVGGIPFTLEEDAFITDTRFELKKSEEGEIEKAYGFMPFGENPKNGDSFLICFDKQPNKSLRLFVKLMPYKGFVRIPMEEGYYTLASLRFDIQSEGRWHECKVLDKTYGFTQSGEIALDLPMSGTILRCTLENCELDLAPMLEKIYLNYNELVQYIEIYGGQADTYLAENGSLIASFKRVKDGYIKAIGDEKADIEVFADKPYRDAEYQIENNQVKLNTAPLHIVQDGFSLLACGRSGIYREWSEVSDLSCSLPSDRHYMLDSANGIIYFGDNIHGRGAKSIVITSMQLSQGEVKVKDNLRFNVGIAKAKNPLPSSQGFLSETPDAAFRRISKELKEPKRAITLKDYKELALKTAGLCIESVNVSSNESGVVNISVKPAGGKLSKNYVRNILKQLYDKKLPCIEVRVCQG